MLEGELATITQKHGANAPTVNSRLAIRCVHQGPKVGGRSLIGRRACQVAALEVKRAAGEAGARSSTRARATFLRCVRVCVCRV